MGHHGPMLPSSNPGLEDIRRTARGESEGLAGLYAQFASVMLALGVRMLRQHKEAEDILHDVFLEVWKRAGDYDPRRGSVKTWLMVRMRSRCLDRIKSAGYARTSSLDARADWGPSVDASRIELAVNGKRARYLLAGLPVEQMEVLALGFFQGLSSSEIATTLSIPIGTVKSRVAAALSKLRGRLDVGQEERA
jgi:RNA polymerase sigma-70 factor (ECF subfamily)